jgi:membrane-bound lytic murein transglycosylase D
MSTRWLLLLTSFVCAACASAPRTTGPVPVSSRTAALSPAVHAPTQQELDEYRHELENAYAHISSRASAPPPETPHVDVEAVVSMDIPEHRLIRGAVSYFSGELKPGIQTYLTRSARYKKMIDKILDEYKLPRGLAYLPVIESGFSPTMTSRSGAHGLWQFMPDTAREYGLRVDWWVDERADVERETRIAAQYLRDLYRQFDDWSLALAAYNAGPGRIRRAMKETGAKTFWELCDASAIPKETRGYVPTFFATLIIASDPQTYGFKLTDPMMPDERRVDLEGPFTLKYLAEAAKVDEATLRELNPALKRGLLPPGKMSVRLPSKAAEAVATRAATLRNEDVNLPVTTFTLREGDSVERLAAAIGTTSDTVLAMNGISSADRVHEGDSIYLPVLARELGMLLNGTSEARGYYAVAKGDTLYSIAKKYSISVDELRELNQLDQSQMLQPGQRLRVLQPKALTAGGM